MAPKVVKKRPAAAAGADAAPRLREPTPKKQRGSDGAVPPDFGTEEGSDTAAPKLLKRPATATRRPKAPSGVMKNYVVARRTKETNPKKQIQKGGGTERSITIVF